MKEPPDSVIGRVKVREVAGVFRSREELDAALDALLVAGFDRSDIDVTAGADAVRERIGTVYVAAEELADVPRAPRQHVVKREDATLVIACIAGILTFAGAAVAGFIVVAAGGALAAAGAAAAGAGAVAGLAGGFLAARHFDRQRTKEFELQLAAGGLVLWARVRSAEREETAQRILQRHGAEAVRVHEVALEKRAEDLPLGSLRPDPWLGSEPLGRP